MRVGDEGNAAHHAEGRARPRKVEERERVVSSTSIVLIEPKPTDIMAVPLPRGLTSPLLCAIRLSGRAFSARSDAQRRRCVAGRSAVAGGGGRAAASSVEPKPRADTCAAAH